MERSAVEFRWVILISKRRVSLLSHASNFVYGREGKSYLFAGNWYFRLWARFHGCLYSSSCSGVGPGAPNEDSASTSCNGDSTTGGGAAAAASAEYHLRLAQTGAHGCDICCILSCRNGRATSRQLVIFVVCGQRFGSEGCRKVDQPHC